MKMKHYLSLLCGKVYADRLLSGVNQTRISQGELIPRIKSCWRVRTEELKYLTVVRKYRPSLLPARIRSFSRRPGEFLLNLQLHAGQLLVFRAGRATPARRAEKDWGGGWPPCRNVAHVLLCVWWVPKRPPATSSSCITFAFWPQLCRQKHHALLLNW